MHVQSVTVDVADVGEHTDPLVPLLIACVREAIPTRRCTRLNLVGGGRSGAQGGGRGVDCGSQDVIYYTRVVKHVVLSAGTLNCEQRFGT